MNQANRRKINTDMNLITFDETSAPSESSCTNDADLKDFNVSETGDRYELMQLIELRTKLQSAIMNTETQALTLEQEICKNQVSEEKTRCGTCGLVQEPRQRKVAELRLMHQTMIKKKPKNLLCTAGIITRLEAMILDGLLDFHHGSSINVPRCQYCRQVRDENKNRQYLLQEIIEILKKESKNCTMTDNCSMSQSCSACLNFMVSNLSAPKPLHTLLMETYLQADIMPYMIIYPILLIAIFYIFWLLFH